jgi:hypothetical protein
MYFGLAWRPSPTPPGLRGQVLPIPPFEIARILAVLLFGIVRQLTIELGADAAGSE